MRIKWHFWNEPFPTFSEILSFTQGLSGHLLLMMYFWANRTWNLWEKPSGYSNLSSDQWRAVCSLANDHNIVIKKADKGWCMVVWDRCDYVMEAEKQLIDSKVY